MHLQHPGRSPVEAGPAQHGGRLPQARRRSSLEQALERAGTVVCEPIVRASGSSSRRTAIGAVLAALARLGATVETPSLRGKLATIETVLSAMRAQDLQRQLPGLTSGEGVLDSSFAGYQPVNGEPPVRDGR